MQHKKGAKEKDIDYNTNNVGVDAHIDPQKIKM